MSQTQNTVNRARPGLFIALFLLIISLYLSTYSGRIESSDSLRVVDAVSSLAHFGDSLRDESLWQEAPRQLWYTSMFPFAEYEPREPLVMYAASIPYAIASIIPGIGLVHATWLLNIFVVTISVLLFFYLAQLLNYHSRTALIAALIFASATIVWTYSKTLFRDPLVMPFLLLTVIFLELWRRDYRKIWYLLPAIVMMTGAYYTKNSSIAAVPALFVWILPAGQVNKILARVLNSLYVTGLFVLIAVVFINPVFDFFAGIVAQFIFIDTTFVQTALHSYLFSIGGSLWGTSPILLAGFIGAAMLLRQERYRLVFSVTTLIVGYAAGHAFLADAHWFGGLSLPPRFMVATIPFAMILVLPVIEHSLDSDNIIVRGLFFLLVIFSLIVQIIFALSLLDGYVELLPPEANGLVEWLPGLNRPQYLRWWLLPQSWNSLGWDIAWRRINANFIGTGFVLIALLAGVAIIYEKRRNMLNTIVLIALLVLTGLGFRQLYQEDVLYWADTPELFEVLSIIETQAEPDEPLFLAGSADVTYERFILNYNHADNFRPVVTGFQPGERASASDSPAPETNITRDFMDTTMLRYIDHIIGFQDRFWWLAHNSMFTPWSVRPEERYFTENYYLLNEYQTGNPTVRLLEFAAVNASPRMFRLPDYASEFRFGEHISLIGYTLSSGTQYSAGDVVPITFTLQTDTVLEVNYTVSWFLVQSDGLYLPIQGVDSMPGAGFSPTREWEAGELILDNRAIELPQDVPSGEYQIWLRLYETGTDGSQPLIVSGGESYEQAMAILMTRIDVLNED